MTTRFSSFAEDSVLCRQLEQVEEILLGAVGGNRLPPSLHRQLFSRRSKRLRPALLLIAARTGPAAPALQEHVRQEQVMRAAAAIEMLHEGTLLQAALASVPGRETERVPVRSSSKSEEADAARI